MRSARVGVAGTAFVILCQARLGGGGPMPLPGTLASEIDALRTTVWTIDFMNAAYQGRNTAASLQNLSTWIEHNDAIKHALRVVQQRCDELEDEVNDAGLSGLRGDPEIEGPSNGFSGDRGVGRTARIRSTQPGGRRLRDRVVIMTQNEGPNVREARGCPPHLTDTDRPRKPTPIALLTDPLPSWSVKHHTHSVARTDRL